MSLKEIDYTDNIVTIRLVIRTNEDSLTLNSYDDSSLIFQRAYVEKSGTVLPFKMKIFEFTRLKNEATSVVLQYEKPNSVTLLNVLISETLRINQL